MTNMEKVTARYPNASIEIEGSAYVVWDISREEQRRLNREYGQKHSFGRGMIGIGKTEHEAWADAVRQIGRREGFGYLGM